MSLPIDMDSLSFISRIASRQPTDLYRMSSFGYLSSIDHSIFSDIRTETKETYASLNRLQDNMETFIHHTTRKNAIYYDFLASTEVNLNESQQDLFTSGCHCLCEV